MNDYSGLDNSTRWAADVRRGTLNFQTATTRLSAAREVVVGDIVSLGLPMTASTSGFELKPLPSGSDDYVDEVVIAPHGFEITHLDATGHTFWRGKGFGGTSRESAIDASGLAVGSVTDLLPGIFCRGVLLDVAEALGTRWLHRDHAIARDELLAAEALTGTRVGTGDAVFLHTGSQQHAIDTGAADIAPRPGITEDCVRWLHEREVSVYSGDCIEQLPSSNPALPMPLHQLGHVMMGLVILDNVDMSSLVERCRHWGRRTFLLTCAPLPMPGASGSAVNPLAAF